MKITAKIIQSSFNYETGTTIRTYELEYPRYIHSEFMTHRQFSRNSASSRAIPIAAMHQQILAADVEFVHYGMNQPGMQSKEELNLSDKTDVRALWFAARNYCLGISQTMASHKAHKQLANRVTEPWMMMKVVMTTTEEANWTWLRKHSDAQPEIHELAIAMDEAASKDTPLDLHEGEWHVPYVDRIITDEGKLLYHINDSEVSAEVAIKVSASCCAQVSYRKSDDSFEKAMAIYDRLINSEPVHASPVEHQATPIVIDMFNKYYGDITANK
jgi:thymidylate synthase ThyX